MSRSDSTRLDSTHVLKSLTRLGSTRHESSRVESSCRVLDSFSVSDSYTLLNFIKRENDKVVYLGKRDLKFVEKLPFCSSIKNFLLLIHAQLILSANRNRKFDSVHLHKNSDLNSCKANTINMQQKNFNFVHFLKLSIFNSCMTNSINKQE